MIEQITTTKLDTRYLKLAEAYIDAYLRRSKVPVIDKARTNGAPAIFAQRVVEAKDSTGADLNQSLRLRRLLLVFLPESDLRTALWQEAGKAWNGESNKMKPFMDLFEGASKPFKRKLDLFLKAGRYIDSRTQETIIKAGHKACTTNIGLLYELMVCAGLTVNGLESKLPKSLTRNLDRVIPEDKAVVYGVNRIPDKEKSRKILEKIVKHLIPPAYENRDALIEGIKKIQTDKIEAAERETGTKPFHHLHRKTTGGRSDAGAGKYGSAPAGAPILR